MKKITLSLIAAVAFGFVLSASAQTTLATVAASVRDTSVQEDQSSIPHQGDRVGHVSFVYDVARDGGTGAVAISPALPAGTAVRGGFVQVTTAVTPATATNAISVLAANDLLTAGTSLQSTGMKMLNVASGAYVSGSTTNTLVTLKSPIVTTSAVPAYLTWTGATATQGVFYVHLDLVKVQ